MSTNSISKGGMDAQLTTRTAATAARPGSTPPSSPVATVTSVGDSTPAPKSTPPLSEDDVRELVADMKQALEAAAKQPFSVDFRPDERAHGYVIEIRSESGELVRQFPPELVLNLRSKLDELSGMVIDQVT